jgi:hypothetical protein
LTYTPEIAHAMLKKMKAVFDDYSPEEGWLEIYAPGIDGGILCQEANPP